MLVVEDRANALAALDLLLRSHGFHVLGATDVESGLALLDEWSVDAIVADLRLGEGKPDGAVLLDSARRWHGGVKCRLLLTADSLGAQHAEDTDSVWLDRGEEGWTARLIAALKAGTGAADA